MFRGKQGRAAVSLAETVQAATRGRLESQSLEVLRSATLIRMAADGAAFVDER